VAPKSAINAPLTIQVVEYKRLDSISVSGVIGLLRGMAARLEEERASLAALN
jgi:hypothetical protein